MKSVFPILRNIFASVGVFSLGAALTGILGHKLLSDQTVYTCHMGYDDRVELTARNDFLFWQKAEVRVASAKKADLLRRPVAGGVDIYELTVPIENVTPHLRLTFAFTNMQVAGLQGKASAGCSLTPFRIVDYQQGLGEQDGNVVATKVIVPQTTTIAAGQAPR